MEEGTTKQAFREVYDIIRHMEDELSEKIPKSFKEILKENMDLAYPVKIDYGKSINEQELLHETRIILSLIYRDYLCSPEKRKELMEADRKEL